MVSSGACAMPSNMAERIRYSSACGAAPEYSSPRQDQARTGGDPGRPESHVEVVSDGPRRPGRPRKWGSNAERMRAYRARQRQVTAPTVDLAAATEAAAENHRLRERVAQLEDERDRLWAQIRRVHDRIRELERGDAADESAATKAPSGLARAERRRLARELARQQRRRAEGNPRC